MAYSIIKSEPIIHAMSSPSVAKVIKVFCLEELFEHDVFYSLEKIFCKLRERIRESQIEIRKKIIVQSIRSMV